MLYFFLKPFVTIVEFWNNSSELWSGQNGAYVRMNCEYTQW